MPEAPALRRESGGRPTLLNDEVHDSIVNALRKGVPIRHACREMGIHEDTFFSWVAKGNAERARLDTTGGTEPGPAVAVYLKFAEATVRARGESVRLKVEQLNRMAEGELVIQETTKTLKNGSTVTDRRYAQPNAQAVMFMLERHPDTRPDFGRHDRLELSGPEGGPIAVSVKDELTALIEASARRVMGEPPALVEAQALEAPE